jgi:hypothetical protein
MSPLTIPARSGRFLARPFATRASNILVCQIGSFKACAMNKKRHSKTAAREAAKTRALINDLVRIVQILEDAIKAEEELAGVFDPLEAQYPMHARKLAARRNNLMETIAALSSPAKTAPYKK